MTTNRPRHEFYEELISASLSGDVSDAERLQLDAHLERCEACRATVAAFGEQRRIVAGMRHVGPPRDLAARVRTGIERGAFAAQPWWRRPAVFFAGVGGGLAAIAGALLAIVLLNGAPGPQVGQATPTPGATSVATAAPSPTVEPFPTAPVATPVPTAVPTASPPPPDPTPSPTPIPSPEPDLYLAFTGPHDNLALTVREGSSDETLMELDTPSGPPVAAELSPDGQWLAYITGVGQSGRNELRATRVSEGGPSEDPDARPPVDSSIEVGQTVILGESLAGSPFLEHLFWSPTSDMSLAYTLAEPDEGTIDVWVFDPASGERRRVTDVGNAYAGSWVPGDGGSPRLWISIAADEPVSHLQEIHEGADAGDGSPVDPAENPVATAERVFQPLLSPNGSLAIYWSGRMSPSGDEWAFVSAGQPYLSEHTAAFTFDNERPVFSDLFVDSDAFTSAAIAWGRDGDAYAIWNAQWSGLPQAGDGEAPYPDPGRVYFGRATDAPGLTRAHAIDLGDIPEGSSVVDVKISPTGEHLVITALRPVGGVMEAPRADLLLVERNTGDEPDAVRVIRSADDGWFGPAGFDGP